MPSGDQAVIASNKHIFFSTGSHPLLVSSWNIICALDGQAVTVLSGATSYSTRPIPLTLFEHPQELKMVRPNFIPALIKHFP